MKLTPEIEAALLQALKWVAEFDPRGRTYREFYAELHERLGPYEQHAHGVDADEALAERYFAVLELADDRGLFGPEDRDHRLIVPDHD